MSQRRPKLPVRPGEPPADLRAAMREVLADPPEYTVKFVCTDRGQHARVVLHHLKDTRGDTGASERVMWPEGQKNRAPLTSWCPEAGPEGFRFRCGRCGTNVEMRQETLFRLLDGLAALPPDPGHAHRVVDISLLPFLAVTRLVASAEHGPPLGHRALNPLTGGAFSRPPRRGICRLRRSARGWPR
jgi:hypothetical protein